MIICTHNRIALRSSIRRSPRKLLNMFMSNYKSEGSSTLFIIYIATKKCKYLRGKGNKIANWHSQGRKRYFLEGWRGRSKEFVICPVCLTPVFQHVFPRTQVVNAYLQTWIMDLNFPMTVCKFFLLSLPSMPLQLCLLPRLQQAKLL